MTTIVTLTSADRSAGSSHEGMIDLSGSLDGKYELRQVVLGNSIYNVTAGNNQVYFAESGMSATATLTLGNYSASQLATELKTQMDAVGGQAYTVAYSDTTHKYTVSAAANFGFEFESFTSNRAHRLIGWDPVDDVEALSLTSDTAIDLTPFHMVYFDLPASGSPITLSSGESTAVYVSSLSEFGGVSRQEYDGDVVLTFSRKTQIDYRVHDHSGATIDLNGADWTMVFELQ